MQKFRKWLDKNPGQATQLRKKLGINATNVSNVKHERRALPAKWIPVIVELSSGKFTHEELLRWRLSLTTR
jgi:DNA-binding transcriptional regulator YdaS (Cro superfamily)